MNAWTISFVLMLMLSGCAQGPVSLVERPETAGTMAQHELKDSVVLTEADAIDAIAPAAKPHTDAQRQAVAAAPAEDLQPLFDQFNAVIDQQQKRIAQLEGENDDLRNQALREQARWLTWSGVSLLAAFGVSMLFGGGLAAAFKTWPLAVLGAGCFGLAQLISHPWFLRGFVALILLGLGYAVYYVWDRHNEGRLKESLQKKAKALEAIVPALDESYDTAADVVREALQVHVFDRLSKVMDRSDKAVVLEVKADQKKEAA